MAQTTKLVTAATAHGAVPVTEVEEALAELEIRPEHRAAWIARFKAFPIVDGLIMRCRTLGDRAEMVLLTHGQPMSRDELSSQIGVAHDVSSLVDLVRLDPRFRRTGRAQVGLASWPHEPYLPIIEQIVQEIERSGGEAEIDRMIPELAKKGNILEASVRIAVFHPQFIRPRPGFVAIRRGDAKVRSRRSLEMTPDCYRLTDGWALRVPVSENILRGFGSRLPTSFAIYLGLQPGQAGVFRTPYGNVTHSWKTQAIIGSIRLIAEALGAQVGDQIFLELLDDSSVRPHHVSKQELLEVQGDEWIARRVGMQTANWRDGVVPGLANALGLDEAGGQSLWAVRWRLQERGETDLLDRLPTDSVDVDADALDELLSYCAVGL